MEIMRFFVKTDKRGRRDAERGDEEKGRRGDEETRRRVFIMNQLD